MVEDLLKKYALLSDQLDATELRSILTELEATIQSDIPGDVVEFGCYKGTASVFIRRMLDSYGSDKSFHVYDSFEGLPEKSSRDNSPSGVQFKAGELYASKKDYIQTFKKLGLRPPYIHKGWFEELTDEDIPGSISFAFLDGDYYSSIWSSLKLIEKRLSAGAVFVIDDYSSEALPGAQKAVDEWMIGKSYSIATRSSLAIIRQL